MPNITAKELPRIGYIPTYFGNRGCGVFYCQEQHTASGFCGKHYHLQRTGRLDSPYLILQAVLCGFSNCENEARAGFLCKSHAKQYASFGHCWEFGTCRECGEPWQESYSHGVCDQCLKSPSRRHNIPRKVFEAMVEAANINGCAICGVMSPGGLYDTWHTDHDHKCCPDSNSCGKCVRGLLCWRCNVGLGIFSDDIDSLISASVYLLSYANKETRQM
jgi:hypothetical protein